MNDEARNLLLAMVSAQGAYIAALLEASPDQQVIRSRARQIHEAYTLHAASHGNAALASALAEASATLEVFLDAHVGKF